MKYKMYEKDNFKIFLLPRTIIISKKTFINHKVSTLGFPLLFLMSTIYQRKSIKIQRN